jgi:hypothetical protein
MERESPYTSKENADWAALPVFWAIAAFIRTGKTKIANRNFFIKP